jgi:hypothetical protein
VAGRQDSNPDTQIQSSSEGEVAQQIRRLRWQIGEKYGKTRNTAAIQGYASGERCSGRGLFDFEDDSCPNA